jgi:hypothetical protein
MIKLADEAQQTIADAGCFKFKVDRCYANTVKVDVKSSKYAENNTIWNTFILFKDFFSIARDKDIPFADAINYAIDSGDVHVGCNCPAFKMWGYSYLSKELGYDYGFMGDNREPKRNNTGLNGTICKHLNRSLNHIKNNRQSLIDMFASYYNLVKDKNGLYIIRPKVRDEKGKFRAFNPDKDITEDVEMVDEDITDDVEGVQVVKSTVWDSEASPKDIESLDLDTEGLLPSQQRVCTLLKESLAHPEPSELDNEIIECCLGRKFSTLDDPYFFAVVGFLDFYRSPGSPPITKQNWRSELRLDCERFAKLLPPENEEFLNSMAVFDNYEASLYKKFLALVKDFGDIFKDVRYDGVGVTNFSSLVDVKVMFLKFGFIFFMSVNLVESNRVESILILPTGGNPITFSMENKAVSLDELKVYLSRDSEKTFKDFEVYMNTHFTKSFFETLGTSWRNERLLMTMLEYLPYYDTPENYLLSCKLEGLTSKQRSVVSALRECDLHVDNNKLDVLDEIIIRRCLGRPFSGLSDPFFNPLTSFCYSSTKKVTKDNWKAEMGKLVEEFKSSPAYDPNAFLMSMARFTDYSDEDFQTFLTELEVFGDEPTVMVEGLTDGLNFSDLHDVHVVVKKFNCDIYLEVELSPVSAVKGISIHSKNPTVEMVSSNLRLFFADLQPYLSLTAKSSFSDFEQFLIQKGFTRVSAESKRSSIGFSRLLEHGAYFTYLLENLPYYDTPDNYLDIERSKGLTPEQRQVISSLRESESIDPRNGIDEIVVRRCLGRPFSGSDDPFFLSLGTVCFGANSLTGQDWKSELSALVQDYRSSLQKESTKLLASMACFSNPNDEAYSTFLSNVVALGYSESDFSVQYGGPAVKEFSSLTDVKLTFTKFDSSIYLKVPLVGVLRVEAVSIYPNSGDPFSYSGDKAVRLESLKPFLGSDSSADYVSLLSFLETNLYKVSGGLRSSFKDRRVYLSILLENLPYYDTVGNYLQHCRKSL